MHTPYRTTSPEETLTLGKKLAARLKMGDVILLFGDLGAGKTQLSKGIAAGLEVTGAVKSPTFTYVNQHKIEGGKLHHYDLYRLKDGDDTHSIGLWESIENPNAITLIEWADRLGDDLPASHIRLDLAPHDDHHEIRLTFVDGENFDEERVGEFCGEWQTPIHVRAHNAQVASVAKQVALAYAEAGEIVDLDHLYFAAILHDIARVCDFRSLEKDNFSEEITDKKWAKWEAIRKEFKGRRHGPIAADFLASKGCPLIGELIRPHETANIVKSPELLNSLEAKILFYADKRVKHDQIVSVSERQRDGRERNGRDDDEGTRALYDEAGERVRALEKELFAPLSITPDDIK